MAFLVVATLLLRPAYADHADPLLVDNGDVTCDDTAATTSAVPFCSIQAAIDHAQPGDTIQVAAGTYTESLTIAKDDLTIEGAGAASTIVQAHTTAGAASSRTLTIINGVAGVDGVTIAHLTIRHGVAPSAGAGGGGGVMAAGATNLLISDSVITHNGTMHPAGGGGVQNSSGDMTLLRTIVRNNEAGDAVTPRSGGGILNTSGSLTLDNTEVRDNVASGGGGVEIIGGTVTVVNGSTIVSNDAQTGAGIRNLGTLIMNSSTIAENIATSFGGGISNEGIATLTNAIVQGNEGSSGAGIENGSGGQLTIEDGSEVRDNIATGNGGGIWNRGTSAYLYNSIVSGNQAGGGGGGVMNHGPLVSSRSTITGNTAGGSGGGIANGHTGTVPDSVGALQLAETVVEDNEAADDGGGLFVSFGTVIEVWGSAIVDNRAPTGDGGGIYHSFGSMDVEHSMISGNTSLGGAQFASEASTTATHNWWGDPSGPSGLGPGTGSDISEVSGGSLAFTPWLRSLVVTPTDPAPDTGTAVDVEAQIVASDDTNAGHGLLTGRFARTGANPGNADEPFGAAPGPAVHTYTGTSTGDDTVAAEVLFAGLESGLEGSGLVSWDVGAFQLSITKAGSGAGTVMSTPAGINCGPQCFANFTAGSTVTLTATPDVGSTFTGWSGPGCGATLTMPAAHHTCTPTFDLDVPSPPGGSDDDDRTTQTILDEEGLRLAVECVRETTVMQDEATSLATVGTCPDVSIEAPAGALPAGHTLVLATVEDVGDLPSAEDASPLLGVIVQLHDEDGDIVDDTFTAPAVITVEVEADLIPERPQEVLIAFWTGDAWLELLAVVTEQQDGSLALRVEVEHFTLFGVLEQPGRGLLSPPPAASGASLARWGGGPIALLPPATSYWVLHEGQFFSYSSAVPDFANARFVELFRDGIPTGTFMVVVNG